MTRGLSRHTGSILRQLGDLDRRQWESVGDDLFLDEDDERSRIEVFPADVLLCGRDCRNSISTDHKSSCGDGGIGIDERLEVESHESAFNHDETALIKSTALCSVQELFDYVKKTPKCRAFFLRQRYSWGPLLVTSSLFHELILQGRLSPQLKNFILCFGTREREVEIAPPAPRFTPSSATTERVDCSHECTYGLRFVENNGRDDPKTTSKAWSLRQCAISCRYTPNEDGISWAFITISEHMQQRLHWAALEGGFCHNADPFEVHQLIVDSAISSWRQYLICLASETDTQYAQILGTSPVDNSPVSLHESGRRQDLLILDEKLLNAMLAVTATTDTISALSTSWESLVRKYPSPDLDRGELMRTSFEHHQRSLKLLAAEITSLRTKLASVTGLLSSFLDLSSGYSLQKLAQESSKENEEMRRLTDRMHKLAEKSTQDAAAVKVLTILTLIYLPVTVVSNFFSTSFVNSTTSANGFGNITVTDDWWILFAASVPLTLLTIYIWLVWTRIQANPHRQAWWKYVLEIMLNSLSPAPSTKPKAKDGRSSRKRLFQKFIPRKSPIAPGSTDGPRSESGSGISQEYSQVDVGTGHAQFLSIEVSNGHENTLRPSLSADSERPDIRARPSRHERQSSSISRRRHVRLPSQEQAAAAEGTIRLNASQVRCTLIVAYHQPSPADHDAVRQEAARIEQMTVDFEEDTAFDELHAIATEHLVSLHKRSAEAYYLKVGRFRIVRDDTKTVAARGILERKDLWNDDLPRKIHAFRGQNYQVDFHVDIEWEYSSLHIVRVANQTYAETIRRAIESKIRTNWENHFYVPRKDLLQIMTKDTISNLIHEDTSLQSPEALRLNGGRQVDVTEFIDKVDKWAARLLAWCIYSRLELVSLYHMLKKELKDKNLPLTIADCPDEAYVSDFRNNAPHSGGFAAYTFIRNERGLVDHEQLHDGAVVPIIFDPNNPDCKLGQGSFGVVFKARIDRDHHSFSDFDDEDFALKKFNNLDADAAASVEAESDLLARLADAPHPNITTHLASWKQGGVCYMLFRCADYNLRRYMARELSPKWTKSKLSAIIGQMAGLADGLRHIHNLGPANLQPDGIQKHAEPGHHHHSQAGYHHDLKPGNILVTINRDTEDLLFSISDFGSAKMGQILSGSERPSQFTRNPYPGDPVYGAPDTILEGKSSRPYDIWSMGCVMLELLTWIIGIEGNSVQTFQDARLETIANAYGDQDTAFWYQDAATRSISLKPSVVEQLKILKKHCEGRGVFPDLIHWTGKMLNVHPGRRPDASQVSNAFKAIMLQLQQDLKNEAFYMSDLPTRVTIAAPPTPTGSQGGLSRTPSIDERPVSSRYAGNLSPDPKASRRQERLNAGSVHADVGVRRADLHTRHNSAPVAMGRLGQIRTDDSPYSAGHGIDGCSRGSSQHSENIAFRL
ncbi:hypothetical protein LTR93_003397 [Exophiala xenobiotica]|nr:hypothetical protein LTR93_003397 [Exophiala xenobiotica]